MKKILITGGNGYIGENLQLRYNNKYEFDICDYGTVNPIVSLAQHLSFDHINEYDAIIHLAALSGLAACEKNHKDAVEKNILTAMNIFRNAYNANIPVVFTSSQAVKVPNSSKYAFMKWTCEKIAEIYNNADEANPFQQSKDIRNIVYVLRLSNVYGGHEYLEKKQTCVKQFITRYREGKPLIVHGDGKQKRDFIHVYDVCEAIIKCIELRPIYKDPIDIGTGKATSIMQIQAMFPKQNQHYEFQNIRNIGADSSIANTDKAKKLLHFEAKRKLQDYIKEMI